MISKNKKNVVVIGNGMVGHRLCEKLVEYDHADLYKITTFCEEPRAAYDRVGLTSFFAHRDAEKLMIARLDWYRENGIDIHVGDRANKIDRKRKIVYSDKGCKVSYDMIVLATGSYPFVPPVEGIKNRGVFVYRTIEDLRQIIAYGKKVQRAAVIGGGLLGLEAAKAAYDLGLETHVVEFAPRLMPRQIDDAGSRVLVRKIEDLGVHIHLSKATKKVLGDGRVDGMVFADGQTLDVGMIIVSAGIRPRDDLASDCNLEIGKRGGVVVDDQLRTSDENIHAIGEVALHNDVIYGLVAPGYKMADVVAANLTGQKKRFTGTDVSTKLKLMGVDVASFGDHDAGADRAKPLTFEDPFSGVYKKLLFDHVGEHLLGGILVGDASDYSRLLMMCKSDQPIPCTPAELIGGPGQPMALAGSIGEAPDDAQVCSCNNVSKAEIRKAVRDQELNSIDDIKHCTKAGAGCGGCVPTVSDILNSELIAAGKSVKSNLCEHFAYSRQELYEIAKINRIKTFDQLIASHGNGNGCEICKPTIGSIMASLWNDTILEPDHQTIQDTNDRFLANMQRGGLYSVIPRVPGGEITPDKLVTLGRVAKKYGLYTKITGGQRVDLFGAQMHQLPDIWEELTGAGFESGHAYGKAVRTVKSCVGTTWCRYGVQDSVGFAIRLEERYRGIRAPHKIKFAVSGCIRECAEAQCKDVGLVATDKGYNLYVCGNGGAKPRHADLLAADIDEETAVKYIDRFLMYYIQTADKLTRTSVWLEKREGGLEHLKRVVIHDKLGICDELQRQMRYLVDSYKCEWKEVVNDPQKRRLFRQFVNTDETEPGIELVAERGQTRPADWPSDGVSLEDVRLPNNDRLGSIGTNRRPATPSLRWVKVGNVDDFPKDGGAAVKYGDVQIAVFNFASRGQWYACQNMCPHKKAFVLSRGIVGNVGEAPKVACPLHKKAFSLQTGQCVSGDEYSVKVFPVRVEGHEVLLRLPPVEQLNALLATHLHQIKGACQNESPPQCASCG